LVWVDGKRKNRPLLIRLLQRLAQVHARAKVIHVIVDNCRIHGSHITQEAAAWNHARPFSSPVQDPSNAPLL
jgi:hypothetical protein